MKKNRTPYQVKATKDEKEKIKTLIHNKKPYGMTNMEFLIKILEEFKGWE